MEQQTLLIQAGLTDDQAKIYIAMLSLGSAQAAKIGLKAGLNRSLAYKIIGQMEEMGLCEKHDEPGKVATFSPSHPSTLKSLVDKKKSELETTSKNLGSNIGSLVSLYNLISGKPNVQFYEGDKGITEVMDDSLYARGEIYTYVDFEAIQKYIPDINKKYASDREKLGIKKKGLVLNTDFNRKFLEDYHTKVTDTRFLDKETEAFKTIMQIYDGKVSYLTLNENEKIGVIIEDKNIYAMHKYLFECLWEKSKIV